jgi:hypothetical protein
LKARSLFRVEIEDQRFVQRETLFESVGRVRDIAQGIDGTIYLLFEHAAGRLSGSRPRTEPDCNNRLLLEEPACHGVVLHAVHGCDARIRASAYASLEDLAEVARHKRCIWALELELELELEGDRAVLANIARVEGHCRHPESHPDKRPHRVFNYRDSNTHRGQPATGCS